MTTEDSIESSDLPDATARAGLRLDSPVTQGAFASIVGVSSQSITRWIERGRLKRGDTLGNWLLAYTAHLRSEAARYTSPESQRLTRERAALAQAQREAQELKNAVTRGEYAPIGLLEDVLATASAAIADRLDGVEGLLRKVAPDLPEPARDAVLLAIASARNEWVRATDQLIAAKLDDDADAVGVAVVPPTNLTPDADPAQVE
jgi:phage terminase Nu1 subunit (DNA packaging protein)